MPNPWADVRAHLLAGLVTAMRCQCVLLPVASGKRIHVFGYDSDLERAEMLYTSLLIQMAHGLAAAQVPPTARSARAWRRSWLLGYASAVTARVRAAEERAASDAGQAPGRRRTSAALVLADRSLVVRRHCEAGVPADPQDADHLLRQRLPFRATPRASAPISAVSGSAPPQAAP